MQQQSSPWSRSSSTPRANVPPSSYGSPTTTVPSTPRANGPPSRESTSSSTRYGSPTITTTTTTIPSTPRANEPPSRESTSTNSISSTSSSTRRPRSPSQNSNSPSEKKKKSSRSSRKQNSETTIVYDDTIIPKEGDPVVHIGPNKRLKGLVGFYHKGGDTNYILKKPKGLGLLLEAGILTTPSKNSISVIVFPKKITEDMSDIQYTQLIPKVSADKTLEKERKPGPVPIEQDQMKTYKMLFSKAYAVYGDLINSNEAQEVTIILDMIEQLHDVSPERKYTARINIVDPKES